MRTACECHFDCGDCSMSGTAWRLHGDEMYMTYPDAEVVA